ncbi:hypothetical protein SALBM217S_00126 [Streptomyces griseoloalbus]
MSELLRAPAEIKYAEELDWLESIDDNPKPFSWRLSPKMVRLFILGSERADGLDREISQKWFGDRSFVERSIVTLASDRGLLLIGDPGTGKSWLAELLSAAICRNSTLVVQGTAGTTEDHIKYSWNVSMVIAKGQSRESMIPSPIMTAMEAGSIGRFEELTRSTSDVQDALISILSEKYISVPELESGGGDDNIVFAKPGFSIIATANSRDRGVNDLSSALKRRFNFVRIPVVTNKKSEAEIVRFRTEELLRRHAIDLDVPPTLLDVLLQSFADLRASAAAAGSDDEKLESALSTAEQIGVLEDAVLHSNFFGERAVTARTLASSLVGSLTRREPGTWRHHQRALIELGYEGVSLEQVLEQRLRREAYGPRATTAGVLAAIEDTLLYLRSGRLADELGTHALKVLAAERSVDGAPEVLRRARALLAYYRTSRPELPAWIESFVKTGYAHYCTLLPTAFRDEDATVGQVAAMLGFLFSMESLALSLGCDRTQLELAVAQSHPDDPSKTALLWAAQVQLGTLSRAELRSRCAELLDNPLVVPSYPRYLNGFVHALEPVPGLADVVVEAVSNAFGRLPDAVLLPWLPLLITTLRKGAADLAPLLIREAGRIFPGRLPALDAWIPPWRMPQEDPFAASRAQRTATAPVGAALLAARPATCDAVAELLGCEDGWQQHDAPARPGAPLLSAHPATCDAVAELLGCDGGWAAAGDTAVAGAALTLRHPATAEALEPLLADR